MKRRISVLLLAVLSTLLFAGCSRKPAETTTPQPTPSAQVPNDANQGGGAGGTNDQNNDGDPDSTPDLDERVENGIDRVEDDVENGMNDVKNDVEKGVEDAKRGIQDATDSIKNGMSGTNK